MTWLRAAAVVTTTALAVTALAVTARPADACRCLAPPLARAVRAADVVFAGTVGKVEVTDHAQAVVHVRAVWKGAVAADVTIHDSPTSCRRGLTEGAALVVVGRWIEGRLTVRQCDGTQAAAPAVERRLTRLLGAPRDPTP